MSWWDTFHGQHLAPLKFFRVTYSGKRAYSFIFPTVFASMVCVVLYFFPNANVAQPGGLLDHSSGLFRMLVGFYVAALGVTVQVSSEGLDKVATDNPPEFNGVGISWREFGIITLSYLVAMAIVTYLFATAILVIQPVTATMDEVLVSRLRLGVSFFYVFIFMHTLAVTVFALFLMSHNLHELKSNSKVPPKQKKQRSKSSSPP